MKIIESGLVYRLLYKQVPDDIDINLIKLFLVKNSNLLDVVLFENSIIGNWNVVNTINYKYILLNIIYSEDSQINVSNIRHLVEKVLKNHHKPSYEDYLNFHNEKSKNTNIMYEVISKIVVESSSVIKESEYFKQINQLINIFNIEFEENTNKNINKNQITLLEDIIETPDQGSLVFIGKCFYYKCKQDIKLPNILTFKLSEKIFGSNETSSIYFKFRKSGKIYTAISSCIPEKGIFLSGVITTYREDCHTEVINEIESIDKFVDIKRFDLIKENLIKEINYLRFEYGTIFIIEPYLRMLGTNIEFKDIYECLDNIDLNTYNMFKNKMDNINLVVNL